MTKITKSASREFMELAIDVMRRSVDEPRQDDKACPKVGAVLLLPDGTTETACRGELRDGDHAEYTLLERKLRSQALNGSVLFATLEPCAPNSRRHPKLGCAERIVLARVREVWVGIEDPDPTVDRKGIKFMQDSGITVHMFDRDLQEVIRGANADFIAQATERAAAASDTRPKPVILSALEQPPTETSADDLSRRALDAYRINAKITDEVDSHPFKRRLVRQGLLKQNGDRFVPTGFGLLLFGEEPRTSMPQAGLLATIHYSDGSEEVKDFDGPQVLVPEQALEWLRGKLPDPIARTGARRQKVNDAIFELVREAVVNALVHRDYNIGGAKCQLVVTPDKITVKSPGSPVDPITVEQLQSFDAPMLSRNPVLHYIFARMELAEERGLGLKSMKSKAQESGLPIPTYVWQNPYLSLTLYLSATGAVNAVASNVSGALSADEKRALEFLATKAPATRKQFAEAIAFDDRKAQRILKRLVELNLIQRVGAGPTTTYNLTNI